MNQLNKAVRDICYFTIFLLSLTAVFWLRDQDYQFFVPYLFILFIVFATRNRREIWPVLLIVVLLITIEIIIGLSITEPIAFCLVLSLFDLFIAFSIVHYHREEFLLKICKVRQPSRQVPQVYLISFVLALSSLYSFLLAIEMVFLELDPQVFGDNEPFLYSIFVPVKVCIKILVDLSIWSLILEPSRWKFLRKLEQRFDS